MKRIFYFAGALAGICAWAVITAPANAADMPVKVQPVAPVTYNWTGWYLGANAGYGVDSARSSNAISGTGTGFPGFVSGLLAGIVPAGMANDPRGAVAGGQAGYNWQTGYVVLGIEADMDWSGIGRTTNQSIAVLPLVGLTASSMTQQQLNWLGTGRVRAGITPWSHVLVYGTGGVAFGDVQTSNAAGITTTIPGIAMTGASNISQTRVGWTAGFGAEFMLNQNWTFRTEALYVDLGDVSGSFLTNKLGPIAPLSVSFNDPYKAWIARAGVNYKF